MEGRQDRLWGWPIFRFLKIWRQASLSYRQRLRVNGSRVYPQIIFDTLLFLSEKVLTVHSLFKTGEVQASSADDAVYYDLEKGGTQEFITSDSSGTTIHIVVEELSGISLFSMNNGSYKISGSKAGFWEASYYISVLNENITRAYSPSATAIG